MSQPITGNELIDLEVSMKRFAIDYPKYFADDSNRISFAAKLRKDKNLFAQVRMTFDGAHARTKDNFLDLVRDKIDKNFSGL